jgi:murein DD-endopeptidase MepM/ murein hydrolase activator NlpD
MIALCRASSSEVLFVAVEDKQLPVGEYDGCPVALYGADLRLSPGTRTVSARLADGREATSSFVVRARPRVEAPLGIPQKLGGNTPAAAQKVVSTLALENTKLASIPKVTAPPKRWAEPFGFPVEVPFVTDSYGYVRDTVGQEITHKGTDFRASVGTPVFSPQDGVVSAVETYTIYGKTVVIDHGFGVESMLMHLSEPLVVKGEAVKAGQLVARAGSTGYAESPHLHLSIRIGGVSIDPEKFIGLFVRQ